MPFKYLKGIFVFKEKKFCKTLALLKFSCNLCLVIETIRTQSPPQLPFSNFLLAKQAFYFRYNPFSKSIRKILIPIFRTKE